MSKFFKNSDEQKELIVQKLKSAWERSSGDITYVYIGEISPEVIEFFQNNGCEIETPELLKFMSRLPVYQFSITDVKLFEDLLAS